MPRAVISNAFSVNMIPEDEKSVVLRFKKITIEEAKKLVEEMPVYSVVGHEGTAALISKLLNIEVKYNRENYVMKEGDFIITFVVPFRLEEGKVFNENEISKIASQMKIFLISRITSH